MRQKRIDRKHFHKFNLIILQLFNKIIPKTISITRSFHNCRTNNILQFILHSSASPLTVPLILLIKISFTAKMVLLDNFLKPEPGPLVIQCTGRTSFSDRSNSAHVCYPCEVYTFHRKGFSLLTKDPPRGHCQERVTNISLAGSCYRQCPTATEDDSLRGR